MYVANIFSVGKEDSFGAGLYISVNLTGVVNKHFVT